MQQSLSLTDLAQTGEQFEEIGDNVEDAAEEMGEAIAGKSDDEPAEAENIEDDKEVEGGDDHKDEEESDAKEEEQPPSHLLGCARWSGNGSSGLLMMRSIRVCGLMGSRPRESLRSLRSCVCVVSVMSSPAREGWEGKSSRWEREDQRRREVKRTK